MTKLRVSSYTAEEKYAGVKAHTLTLIPESADTYLGVESPEDVPESVKEALREWLGVGKSATEAKKLEDLFFSAEPSDVLSRVKNAVNKAIKEIGLDSAP